MPTGMGNVSAKVREKTVTESYQAWDENEYPWPPPAGWYQAPDGLWWPQGHGPGPVAEPAAPAPAVAPPVQAPPVQAPPVQAPPVQAAPPVEEPPVQTPPAQAAPTVAAPSVAPPPAQAPPVAAPPVETPVQAAPPVAEIPAPGFSQPGPPSGAPQGYAAPAGIAAPGLSSPGTVAAPGAPGTIEPEEPESGSKKTMLLVALGLAVAAILVAIPVLLFLKTSDDTESTTSTTAIDGDAPETTVTTAAVDTAPPRGTGPGSLDEPWSVGDPIIVSYAEPDAEASRWTVQVTAAVVDASTILQNADASNPAPAGGNVYAMVPVKLTYKSGPTAISALELNLNGFGASGTVYTLAGNSCGSVPEQLDFTASLQPGDSIEGHVCWEVPASELASLKLLVQVLDAQGVVYIDVNN